MGTGSIGTNAGNGTNATQISSVIVGNAPPEVHNVTISAQGIDNITMIALTPGASLQVNCSAIVTDWDGEGDIANVNATFYASGAGYSYLDADDNNTHYSAYNTTNDNGEDIEANCTWDNSFGDGYEAYASCFFDVAYYAFNGTWTCNITTWDVNETMENIDDYDTTEIGDLVALNVPETIDFGVVNVTKVSHENESNVTNWGNVNMTFSLRGYDSSGGLNASDSWEGDSHNAMNCTLGQTKNITIDFERYNLTESIIPTDEAIPFSDFYTAGNYTAMSENDGLAFLNISARQDDNYPNFDNINTTYWRVYVPVGVAGTCQGVIVYTAQRIQDIEIDAP
jgi:hypothetical protein